jgi:hypothetical protein
VERVLFRAIEWLSRFIAKIDSQDSQDKWRPGEDWPQGHLNGQAIADACKRTPSIAGPKKIKFQWFSRSKR